MKQVTFLTLNLSILIIIILSGCSIPRKADLDLRVVSLNVAASINSPSGAMSSRSSHQWGLPDFRGKSVTSFLLEKDSDIIALQEVKTIQLNDVGAAFNSTFAMVSGCKFRVSSDNTGFTNIYQPILYRHDRFYELKSGCFMLSDTPEVLGSHSWGSGERLATWVQLMDNDTGSVVSVVNVHFAAAQVQEEARRESARVVGDFLSELPVEPSAKIVLGDFNARPDSEVHRILRDEYGLLDSSTAALTKNGPRRTYHAWGRGNVSRQIDYIYADSLNALKYEVFEKDSNGNYLSDHNIIMTTFQFII